MRSPSASVRSGDSATGRNCATCTPAPRNRASGSSPAASPSAASTRNIWRCRSRRSRKGCCRGARTSALRLLMIQDFADDEGFRVAPRHVVVAAEGDEPIENDIPRFHIDNVEFGPLHECAELMKAADQEIAGAGGLRLAKQLIRVDVAGRAGIWRTLEGDISYLPAGR